MRVSRHWSPGHRCSEFTGFLAHSAITDLVYCGELKAIVTASRDSMLKVWEQDWQIRTVFLSHTGAPCSLPA